MTPHSDAQLRHLAEQHRRRIRLSSIAPHVAVDRGYRTVETKVALKRLERVSKPCRVSRNQDLRPANRPLTGGVRRQAPTAGQATTRF